MTKHFLERLNILEELIQEYIDNNEHKRTSYSFGLLNGLVCAYGILIDKDIGPIAVPEEFEEVLDIDVKKVVNAINKKNIIDFAFSQLDDLIREGNVKVQ
jgi:hypothetical protein